MSKNKTRGQPSKRTNRIRDADMFEKVGNDINTIFRRWVKKLSNNKKAILPYAAFFFIGNKLSLFYRCSNAKDSIGKITETVSSFGRIFAWPILSLHRWDLFIGLCFAALIRLLVYIKMGNAKHYRTGQEYGSASFGNEKDIDGFMDTENPYNNIVLSKTEMLSMQTRMSDPSKNRNKNVLVIGGSGSGKTRGHVKPNIMQMYRIAGY